MFYSQFILAKKGPLGTIWIAAHLERKLRKNQVADTDIGVSVDSILSPEVPIALRLSSHLLLGVVRIYSRKVNYLFHDCSEALLKVKQAFRSTAVDLPPEESTAPYHSITLPETFDLDDFELPDSDNFQGNFVDHHVSTREQITLQDSMDGVIYSTSQFGLDERFGDGDTSQGLDLDEELFLDKVTAPGGTAALLDSDNVDLQASGQPMTPFTPFMDMDIDDDDQTIYGEDKMVEDMRDGANGAKFDSNAQDEKIVDDPVPLCASEAHSLNFDGDGFPIKQMENSSIDTLAGSTDYAPFTPRSVEEVVPTNGHFHEDNVHGLVNGTSQCNSEEMTMQDLNTNLQYKSENHDQKFMAQEILGDLHGEPNLHTNGTTETGDCSMLDINSEIDASHMLQDMQAKQQGGSPAGLDMNSLSFDVSHTVSSPTSVLIEQQKPTSPVSGVLDRPSALPGTMERTETSQHEDIINGNSSSTEVLAAPDVTMEATPASSMAETYHITIPSSDSVSANLNCQTVSEVRSQSGCVSHETSEAVAKVIPSGDSVELGTPYGADPSLESVAHELGKNEGSACIGPEIAEVQHHVGLDKQSYEHHHVLQACNSLSKQPASVTPVDKDLTQNTPDLPSMGADPCLMGFFGREPVRAAEISAVVQGEECQQTRTRATVLEANTIFGTVPSNSQAVELSKFDGSLNTVIYKDTQSVNLNFPASCDWAMPAPERFVSAAAAVPFAPSEHPIFYKDSQSVNLNFPATCDFAVPAPGRLLPDPAAVPFAPSGGSVIYKENQSVNLNYPASFQFAVPAPERLLSAPTAAPFAASSSLVHSTSVSTDREVSGAGFETLSGRKRQMMEASPVQWDGSSATLSGMQFQRTVDSIPDDYDLLSSILVGKKSSALKLRPTPQQSEITSKKRQRVAPRTSVAKRKVLLDDIMVLHGDTIRQQLTSTEDIRRIRKKAPCTRPEIWMIQKHLLEDEIFVESLFTGMSPDLVSVHRRTYGAPESRISEMDVSHTLPKVPDEVYHSKTSILLGESNIEGSRGPVVVGNGPMENRLSDDHPINAVECDTQEQTQDATDISPFGSQKGRSDIAYTEGSSEPIVAGNGPTENRLSEEHLINPAECNSQEQTMAETSSFDSQKGGLDIAAYMESTKGSGVANMMAHSDTVVMELPLVTDTISEEKHSETVGFETESFPVNRSNGIETVLQNEKNLTIPSVENDAIIMERSNHKEYNAIHVKEVNEEGIHLDDGVPIKNGGSVHEISQSNSVEMVPQNVPQDHLVNACEGYSSPKNIMLDNCLMENKADVLADALTPLENDEPLIPNTFVGSEESTDPTIVTNDYAEDRITSDPGHVIRDENVREDAGNSASDLISIEDPQRESSSTLECNADTETVPSNEGENPCTQEADLESISHTENPETVPSIEGENPDSKEADLERLSYAENPEAVPSKEGENPASQEADLGRTSDAENLGIQVANTGATVDDETTLLDNASGNLSDDMGDALDDNDTGFLNFDDDEEIEEADNNLPSTEETGFLDNSGWSSRTRGVARYLQTLFDTESGHGREVLPLDKLLLGKSRKEASRMFFETLVLKTRDYIHVEQESPFDIINIKPKGKLVKSDF